MEFRLADHVHAAIRAEDLLMLDTSTGQYGCVPGAGARLRIWAEDGRVDSDAPELLAALFEAEVLVMAAPVPRRGVPPPSPVRDLGLDLRAPASLGALATMMVVTGDMIGAYWRPAFPELVRRVRARQARPLRAGGEAELRRHALQFRDLLPWIPFQGDCLFRSIMLQAYLRRRGLAATLVLGGQTWPFEAHCWTQSGELVLDDSADHAAGFTPLLAL